MNLVDVMAQLGDALDTIEGLRVYRYPPDSIAAPAGIVAYPESINFAAAYQRGMDRITIPVVIVVGAASDRASARQLAEFASGSGARSVKAVIDGHAYTAADSVTVTSADVDVFAMGDIPYIAATFEVDVVGPGA
jgi:hypothetical protein